MYVHYGFPLIQKIVLHQITNITVSMTAKKYAQRFSAIKSVRTVMEIQSPPEVASKTVSSVRTAARWAISPEQTDWQQQLLTFQKTPLSTCRPENLSSSLVFKTNTYKWKFSAHQKWLQTRGLSLRPQSFCNTSSPPPDDRDGSLKPLFLA